MKKCIACGNEFQPYRSSHRYCSTVCSQRDANKRYLDKKYEKIGGRKFFRQIDENRSNGKLSNLVVLCPNCHAIRHYVNLKKKLGFDGEERKFKKNKQTMC